MDSKGVCLVSRLVVVLLAAALVSGLAVEAVGAFPGTAVVAKKKCKKKAARAAKKKKCKKKKAPATPVQPAPPAKLEMSPAASSYGVFTTGTSSNPTAFTITNSGGSPSGAIADRLGGATPQQFSFANDSCFGASLAPGGSCTAQVSFSPLSAGAKSATLDVSAAPGGTLSVPLSGTGVTPASLSISPATPVAFGNTYTGFSSPPSSTLTVTNTGGSTSGTPLAQIGGPGALRFGLQDNTCTSPLVPSGTCEITAVFTPVSDGPRDAVVAVGATPGGSTANVALSGTGVTDLSISPTFHEFGPVHAGDTASFSFTVTNNGSDWSGGSLSGATIAPGADQSRFSAPTITDNCITQPLAPTATCTFVVNFTPGMVATGYHSSDSVSIGANPGGTVSATLNGEQAP
jgi:hypothetical protein